MNHFVLMTTLAFILFSYSHSVVGISIGLKSQLIFAIFHWKNNFDYEISDYRIVLSFDFPKQLRLCVLRLKFQITYE